MLAHNYVCVYCINYFYNTKETADVVAAAAKVAHPQPAIIIRGTFTGNINDAFLICEKQILCKAEPQSSILMLFMAYYVFNMHYCSGCSNVFSFLEVLFLSLVPPKEQS